MPPKPQHQTAVLPSMAHATSEWHPSTNTFATFARGVPVTDTATCTAVELQSDVVDVLDVGTLGLPSCPCALLPQHHAVPSDRTAHPRPLAPELEMLVSPAESKLVATSGPEDVSTTVLLAAVLPELAV